jgi:fructose-1,6-bisphosphatase/sedoheptulose 1,7-bisphosphatase-like protein
MSSKRAGQHAGQHTGLGRLLSLEIVRVTEQAAVAAARLRGRGAEKMSDQAAVDAMRRELSALTIDGTVVIGEGGRAGGSGAALHRRANADAAWLDTEEKRERAAKMGIKDPRRKYQIEDMVKGECLFAATGVHRRPHAARRTVRQRGD